MCRHKEAHYFHRVLPPFVKRLFIYLFRICLRTDSFSQKIITKMNNIQKSTKDLNFIKSITIYTLSQKEIEHCLQLCRIPKTSFNYLRKYGIITKIGKDLFVFQREPIYWAKLNAAILDYRFYYNEHMKTYLERKKQNAL